MSATYIRWFKATFGTLLEKAVRNTPYDENFLAAIACQETGYVWGPKIGRMSDDEILEICVGDTIDAPRRGGVPSKPTSARRVSRGHADVHGGTARTHDGSESIE